MEQSLDPLPQRIAALAAGKCKKPSQPQQQCDLGNHIAPFPPSLPPSPVHTYQCSQLPCRVWEAVV